MKWLLLVLAILSPSKVLAQSGVYFSGVVQTASGLKGGATVTVCSTAVISSVSETGTTVTITTQTAHGFAVGQSVQITGVPTNLYNGAFTILSVPTATTFTVTNANTGLASTGGGLALPNNVPCAPATTIYSDIGLVASRANPITSDGLGNFSFFAPAATYVYTVTGSGILASSGGPFFLQGGVPTNVTNTFTAAQNFDANVALKGPSPWIDILRYGASGDGTITTGSITTGTPTLTLAAAAGFVNGQGIVVWKAGPSPTMATPAAPASVTPTNITGATTYTYQVVAVDSAGGSTAASASTATTTGPATLGYNTATIVTATGLSRVAGVVTVTTTAAHGFNVTNVPVRIAGAADATFNGVWMITGTPAGTTFTFNQSGFPDATSGGGTATVTAFNKITVSTVTGASYYVIYGRVAGSLALIGRTEWGGTTFNDYGATIGTAPTLPAYVPTAPPVAATPQYLATTVSSGGGTTALTLAANASNTATSQTVKHDDGPALVAAINAAVANGGGTVYLPPSGPPVDFSTVKFRFNSTFALPAAVRGMTVMLGGNMEINETILGASNYSFRNVFGGTVAQGSNAQFQGQPQVTLFGVASPLLYFGSGANTGLEFEGITFVGSGSYGNGQNVLFLDKRPAQVTFRRSSFSTNAGNNNFTGAPLLIRGGFDYYFTDCLFTSTGPQTQANNIAPVVLFGVESAGEVARYVYMQNSVFNFAGVKFDYTGVVTGTMGNVFRNILVENLTNNDAFLITFGAFGNQGWVLDNIQVSDVSGPVWNNLNGNLQGATIINSSPWVGGPLVTGLPVAGLQIFNSPSNTNVPRAPGSYADQTFAAALDTGVNPGTVLLSGVTAQNQAAHSENNSPLYWDMKPPTSPSGTLAAGGTLTVGTTYFYKITAVDARNGQTKPSVEVGPVTPTAGNQTVNLSWTAPTGAVKGFYVYRGTSAGGENIGLYPSGVATPTTTATSFSDTGGIATNGASLPTVSGAGVTKLDQTGVVAGNVLAANINNVIYLDGVKYPYTAAGLQFACTDLAAAGGGVIDARGMKGAVTFTSVDVLSGCRGTPKKLLFGEVTITCSGTIPGVAPASANCFVPDSNTEIEGLGPGRTKLFQATGTAGSVRMIESTEGATNIRIHDLEMNGNRANVTDVAVQNHCIFFDDVDNSHVWNVSIHDCNGDGVGLWGGGVAGVAYTGETLGTGTGAQTTFKYTVVHPGIKPGTISIVVGVNTLTDQADPNLGVITGPTLFTGGVDYASGRIVLTFSTAPASGQAITVTYTGNPGAVGATTHSSIHDAVISNIQRSPISVISGFADTIKNVHIINDTGFDGIHCEPDSGTQFSRDLIIEQVSIWSPGMPAGIACTGQTTSGQRVSHNVISDVTLEGGCLNVQGSPYQKLHHIILNHPACGIAVNLQAPFIQADHIEVRDQQVTSAAGTCNPCAGIKADMQSTNDTAGFPAGTSNSQWDHFIVDGAREIGIFVGNTKNLIISDSIVRNTKPDAGTSLGFDIANTVAGLSTGIQLIGNQAFDDQGTPTQNTGFVIQAGVTSPVLIGNRGFGNATALWSELSATPTRIGNPGLANILSDALTTTTIGTATNCSSSASPAACGSASAGSVTVAAAATTVVVNTSAVTANSQILLMYDSSLGAKLGVTCNATEPALYGVTARTAGTSFTITASAPVTNPACFSYAIIN